MQQELEIVLVSRISEVLDAALEKLVANPPPPISTTDAGARQNQTTGQAQPEAVRAREP